MSPDEIKAINRKAVEFFRSHISRAASYLATRGLTEQIIQEYELGVALRETDTLFRHLVQQGVDEEEIVEAGLARKQSGDDYIDRFRDRIVIPIHDSEGDVIAFTARAMRPEQEPKYINSPETPVYNKRGVLYGLHTARKHASGGLIVVEGNLDVLALHQAGFRNAVATCGTALTQQHAEVIRGYTREVYLNLDGDRAGVEATRKALLVLLKVGIRPSVIRLHGAKDPDEFLKANGAEAYRRRLESGASYLEWAIGSARSSFDNSTITGRVETLNWIAPFLRIASQCGSQSVVQKTAASLGVTSGQVSAYLSFEKYAGKPLYSSLDVANADDISSRI